MVVFNKKSPKKALVSRRPSLDKNKEKRYISYMAKQNNTLLSPPINKLPVPKNMSVGEAYTYFIRELCHRYCANWCWKKDSFPADMAKDGQCSANKNLGFKVPPSVWHELLDDPQHNAVSCNSFKLATCWKISRALIALSRLNSTPPAS